MPRYGRGFYEEIFPKACVLLDSANQDEQKKLIGLLGAKGYRGLEGHVMRAPMVPTRTGEAPPGTPAAPEDLASLDIARGVGWSTK